MPDTAPVPDPVVFESRGRIVANSRDVAAFFGKRHDNVVRDIRKLIALKPALSRLNFEAAEYIDEQGKPRPSYDMDRTGLTLLGMGFTGAKAVAFKLQYIEAFDAMEEALKARAPDQLAPSPEQAFPNWPLPVWRARLATVDRYLRLYGVAAAREVMKDLGFPVPPDHLITAAGRQLDLFNTRHGWRA